MVQKCENFGVRNDIVSGLVYTPRINLPILEIVLALSILII